MTIEQKKQVLKSYGNTVRKIKSLQEQLYAFQCKNQNPQVQSLSDMPKGSRMDSDLSDVVARMSELELEISSQIEILNRKRIEIEREIKKLEDGRCSKILWMRYIQLMKWEQIEHRCNYSKRSVMRKHGEALKKIFE